MTHSIVSRGVAASLLVLFISSTFTSSGYGQLKPGKIGEDIGRVNKRSPPPPPPLPDLRVGNICFEGDRNGNPSGLLDVTVWNDGAGAAPRVTQTIVTISCGPKDRFTSRTTNTFSTPAIRAKGSYTVKVNLPDCAMADLKNNLPKNTFVDVTLNATSSIRESNTANNAVTDQIPGNCSIQ